MKGLPYYLILVLEIRIYIRLTIKRKVGGRNAWCKIVDSLSFIN